MTIILSPSYCSKVTRWSYRSEVTEAKILKDEYWSQNTEARILKSKCWCHYPIKIRQTKYHLQEGQIFQIIWRSRRSNQRLPSQPLTKQSKQKLLIIAPTNLHQSQDSKSRFTAKMHEEIYCTDVQLGNFKSNGNIPISIKKRIKSTRCTCEETESVRASK